MRPEALARTAAMNARLRDRLVPQPEPAPERPEWVRIVDSPKLAVTNVGGHEFGSVVRVLRWRKDRPVVPSGPLAHYAYDVTLLRHAWEPADPPTPEPPAAEWKVGDWFTADVGGELDVTEGKPYEVVDVDRRSEDPVVCCLDVVDDRHWFYFTQVARCDPPSDPQPGEMVAVMLSRPLVEWWATHSWRSDRTAPVGAACAAALSQEGGQA